MKRLLIASLMLFLPSLSHALDSIWSVSTHAPEISHSTVTFSSTTVTALSDKGFFEVQLTAANNTYYYRLDSSTLSLTSLGFPVLTGSSATITGYNEINFLFGPGASNQEMRVIKIRPK